MAIDETISKKINEFFSSYPLKRFKKGQIIIYGGEEPGGVFHIVSGKIRQYDISQRGDEVIVNVFQSPAFFPMSWAINRVPNRYFFETTTDVELYQAPADETVAFLKANPEVMYDLLSRLYSGVDGLQRRMAHLMGGDAHSRVLFELIIECRRFGELQKDQSYLLGISEGELAQRTGLSRETVNRAFGKLKTKGLLTYQAKKLSIKSIKSLEAELGDEL